MKYDKNAISNTARNLRSKSSGLANIQTSLSRVSPVSYTHLLGTGCRIGEVLGLRWEDIDYEKRIISINHNLTYYPVGEDRASENHISTQMCIRDSISVVNLMSFGYFCCQIKGFISPS